MRTTEADVRSVVELPAGASLMPFLRAAGLMVDRIEEEHPGTLPAEVLAEIECWLAAHLAALRYLRTTKQKIGDAEENYRQPAASLVGFKATTYGIQAMMLDSTGTLADIQNESENPQKTVDLFSLSETA